MPSCSCFFNPKFWSARRLEASTILMTHGESSLQSHSQSDTHSLQTNACGCRSRSSHGDTDPHTHTSLLIHLSYPQIFRRLRRHLSLASLAYLCLSLGDDSSEAVKAHGGLCPHPCQLGGCYPPWDNLEPFGASQLNSMQIQGYSTRRYDAQESHPAASRSVRSAPRSRYARACLTLADLSDSQCCGTNFTEPI